MTNELGKPPRPLSAVTVTDLNAIRHVVTVDRKESLDNTGSYVYRWNCKCGEHGLWGAYDISYDLAWKHLKAMGREGLNE